MKKTFKGLSAILMTSVLAVSASAATVGTMTAWADSTITINLPNPTNDKATHTYQVYQVFKGDLSGSVLSNIQWGDNINSAALLTDLATADFTNFSGITASSSASDVAKKITNEAAAKSLAKILDTKTGTTYKYLNGTPKTGAAGSAITVDNDGYYFVKDTDDSLANSNGAYTRFIMQVTGTATVTAKEDVPQLTKKIGTDFTTGTTANTACIGDTVPFVLQSSVPDMTGYDKYYFVINDDMESGLTFNSDSEVSVTIGTKTLTRKTSSTTETETEWFDVQTGTAANGHTLQIVFNNFLQYSNLKDQTITVKYSATLNENAELYSNSNDNTVSLTFSNNPNYDYDGNVDNDNPNEPPTDTDGNPTVPTGKTPNSKTETFTTALKLTKVDGDDNTITLANAKFRLSGEGLQAVKVDNKYYKLDSTADPAYYQLADGSFTTTAPTTATSSSYASTTNKYKEVTDSTEKTNLQKVSTEIVTGSDGIISFNGLAPGNYTLTEIEAPPTYNKLASPISITITGSASATSEWTATINGSAASFDSTNKVFTANIENNKGIELPGTGGVGTTIFYIIGGLMISGALVLLIVKKRMSIKEK